MATKSGSQVSRASNNKLSRQDFPSDFVFGSATSSFQIEGGHQADGKSLNNWDVFTITHPGRIVDGSNGSLAIDHFNRFKEDVDLIKKIGLDAYRFSISWSRILPGGRLSAGVNRAGVKFYNDLIDALLAQGIEPYVTLQHFDVPKNLENEYGGFLSPKILQDFQEYAEVCFFEFGDRVKNWITINEPWTFAHNGYVVGSFPPNHGSLPTDPGLSRFFSRAPKYRTPHVRDETLDGGDAGTEPYIVAHHLLLAHALAVDSYRTKYQAVQGGKIGITNMSMWFVPLEDTEEDIAAAKRAIDFMWGWFLAPIVRGEYPAIMRERVGSRLPKFTADQEKLIKGSYDFIGLNYYTTYYFTNVNFPAGTPPNYYTDMGGLLTPVKDGVPIGEQAGSEWLFIVPEGLYNLIMHTKEDYGDPLIFVTENGVDEKNDTSLTVTQALEDKMRIRFHQDHFATLKQAITEGANVKACFAWSMFDNFEWAEGYTVRFGFYYVDFVNQLTRYPKKSAIWYMNFLNKLGASSLKRPVEEIEDVSLSNAAKRLKR